MNSRRKMRLSRIDTKGQKFWCRGDPSVARDCYRSLNMREGPHPVLRHGSMSLTGLVLGEEYISRSESSLGAVAQADLD